MINGLSNLSSWTITFVMGIVSFIVSQCITIPQLHDLYKTRNTSGISLWTYIIFVFASILWVIWSFGFYFQHIQNLPEGEEKLAWLYQAGFIPTVLMNSANLIFMVIILAIKIKHVLIAKKLKVNEMELAKILVEKRSNKYLNNAKKIKLHYLLPTIIITTITILFLAVLTVVLILFTKPSIGKVVWKWLIPLNLVSAIAWEAVSWPQFIKSIKEKDTTGVSIGWAIFLPLSCIILFAYDFAMSLSSGEFDYAIIGSLIFNGIISSVGVMILKFINIFNAKKLGLSEVEYTKKYLIPEVEGIKLAKKDKTKIAEIKAIRKTALAKTKKRK